MYRTALLNAVRLLALGVSVHMTAAAATAQTPRPPDVATMSLQDLLGVEVVSTASKFSRRSGRPQPRSR